MDREELKRLIHEVIDEREQMEKSREAIVTFRFSVVLYLSIFMIAFTLYVLVERGVQLHPQLIQNIILERLMFLGSLLLMSVSLIGIVFAIWKRSSKKWQRSMT